MAGAQLGITLCTLVLGAVAEPAVAHLLEPVFAPSACRRRWSTRSSFAWRWPLVVYLHMVVGEMVPKNLALAEPGRTALLLGPPLVSCPGCCGR